jgi:hypothetical protein
MNSEKSPQAEYDQFWKNKEHRPVEKPDHVGTWWEIQGGKSPGYWIAIRSYRRGEWREREAKRT